MSNIRVTRIAVIAGLGLILTGCGGNSAEIKEYAKTHEMNEVQTLAFTSCAKDLTKNKPIFKVTEGYMVMRDVPFDVCACQTKTMLTVFKEKQYKGHTAFAEYMAKYTKKKPPHIPRKSLLPGLNPKTARAKLTTSLQACIQEYSDAHPKQSAELYKIEPIKEKPKKKEKKAEPVSSS